MQPPGHIARLTRVLIGTVIGIAVIIVGFRLFQSAFSRAEDLAPRDVVVSEISANGAKISWSTGEENQGVVEYGTTPTALNFFAPEGEKTKTHTVELTLLSPTTTYYFHIRIADKKYDNGGVPWTFTTRGTGTPAASNPTAPPAAKPSPVATIVLDQPQSTPTTTAVNCAGTNCAEIKANIGKGCLAADYFKCLAKATPTPAP